MSEDMILFICEAVYSVGARLLLMVFGLALAFLMAIALFKWADRKDKEQEERDKKVDELLSRKEK